MSLNPASYPARSGLVNDLLESQLRQLFGRLTAPVAITCVLGSDDKSAEMAAFLNHICALSDRLRLTLLAPGEEDTPDMALFPATSIGGRRMVFHGVPGGNEINAFVSAILTAGGAGRVLDRATAKHIGKIGRKLELEIIVSLECPICCQLVTAAQRIAWESELVTAHMIDGGLCPELVAERNIRQVPQTFINGVAAFTGGKTPGDLASFLARYNG